jgi:hypothetical protein
LSSVVEKTCDLRVGMAALGLDAQGERRHVEEQDVVDLALEHAALDGGPHGDDLVRVHGLVRRLPEDLGDLLLDARHPRHAADQQHLVDLVAPEPRVFQRGGAGLHQPVDQVRDQHLELLPRHGDVQVLRTGFVGADERQAHVGLLGRGELVLGALRCLLEALEGHAVGAQVDALGLLEGLAEVIDDALVEVLSAQVGVAVGALHLDDVVAELEDRDVEGAAAEVEDGDALGALLPEPVGERRCGRLVDDALHLQAGDAAGILGGLALGIVEVRRHRDHGVGDLLAEEVRRDLLHLAEDHRGELLGRAEPLAGPDPGVPVLGGFDGEGRDVAEAGDLLGVEATPEQALGGKDGALGVGHRLALGDLADELLVLGGEGDHRGGGARALGVGDDLGLAPVDHGHARVRGAEVDTDHPSHRGSPLRPVKRPTRAGLLAGFTR